jgi:hypothetical protein
MGWCLGTFLFAMTAAPPSPAQQAGSRDVQRAYGSRLDKQAVPEVGTGVVRRQSSRLDNRINNRLSTRIERYATYRNPVDALRTKTDDGSRQTTIVQNPLPPPTPER